MTGFICIDKPPNMTSFTAANRARAILGCKKAGHTGTLDPMATGVLPIALSGATRFIELLPTAEKGYTARVRLGLTTDTLDMTGKVLSETVETVTPEQIEEAALSFVGESMQTPPMYSALSKDGVRLYELARRGETVERVPRKIRISALAVSDFSENEFTLSVTCSAGTYVRSLADDIGKKLGCGAVLSALRRTAANGFTLCDCIALDELEALRDAGKVQERIFSVDACLAAYPAITVSAPQAVRFQNGGALFLNRIGNPSAGLYRIYAPDKQFLGIGEVPAEDSADSLTVRRVFVDG
ncbi:MAG: tRNA pseudouridine(55) synthase TruB [Candidatus Fimenecus sp.]